MEKPKWSSSAVRHRAVRLVLKQQREHESQWATIASATGLTLFGAIDDLWADAGGLHYVVEYKATSKSGEVVTCPELCLLRLRFEGVRRRLTARPPRGSCQRLRAGACRARKCRSPEMQSPARTSQGFLSPLTVARAGLSSPASRLGFRRIRR